MYVLMLKMKFEMDLGVNLRNSSTEFYIESEKKICEIVKKNIEK